VACGTAAVAAVAGIVVTGGAGGTAARTGPSPAQARLVAYVTRRVENEDGEDLMGGSWRVRWPVART